MGAFGLDLIWAKNCHQALLLLAHYGNGGSRYEDPCVIDRVEDATVRPGSMARLLRLLKSVDHIYSEERQEQRVIEEDPEEYPLDLEESPAAADQATAAPVVLVPKVTVVSPPPLASSSRPRRKTKCRKLNASHFVDIVALDDDDDDEEEEEEGEERVYHREETVSSGKRTFQDRIDTIIERFSRRTQEDVTSNLPQKRPLIPASPPKSIYVVDFYSGASLVCI